jgi:hypothetical protein
MEVSSRFGMPCISCLGAQGVEVKPVYLHFLVFFSVFFAFFSSIFPSNEFFS